MAAQLFNLFLEEPNLLHPLFAVTIVVGRHCSSLHLFPLPLKCVKGCPQAVDVEPPRNGLALEFDKECLPPPRVSRCVVQCAGCACTAVLVGLCVKLAPLLRAGLLCRLLCPRSDSRLAPPV
jgi:hypothetical protein